MNVKNGINTNVSGSSFSEETSSQCTYKGHFAAKVPCLIVIRCKTYETVLISLLNELTSE